MQAGSELSGGLGATTTPLMDLDYQPIEIECNPNEGFLAFVDTSIFDEPSSDINV